MSAPSYFILLVATLYGRKCFHPDNASELAELMQGVMSEKYEFSGNKARKVGQPFTQSWAELFKLVLNE